MKRMLIIMTGAWLVLMPHASFAGPDGQAPAGKGEAVKQDLALQLAQRWDQLKYNTPDKKARVAGFKKLVEDAKALAQAHPDDPAPKVWAGITLATLAGEDGGLGALGLVKEAKALLEAALTQHPNKELETSIHTTLGSLYYQVPGWPIGFGDEDKAVEHLKKALELSPNGLDANFWMASYLWDETRRYKEAAEYFRRAIAAPPRPGREIADAGRKAEARALLAKVEKKLH